MNFDGFKPTKIARWGGGVDWDDPTQLANGVAIVCKNSRFRAESVATRYGRQHSMSYQAPGAVVGQVQLFAADLDQFSNPGKLPLAFYYVRCFLLLPDGSLLVAPELGPVGVCTALSLVFPPPPSSGCLWQVYYGNTAGGEERLLTLTPSNPPSASSFIFVNPGTPAAPPPVHSGDLTGIDVLRVLGASAQEIPLAYGDAGVLLRETPAGAGSLMPLLTPLILPKAAYMQTALAYNRAYLAFSDLAKGLIPPLVLDGPTGNVSTISQNPIGAPWTMGRFYQIGDLVRTPSGSPRWFRCTRAGVASAIEPTWPLDNGRFQGSLWQPSEIDDRGGPGASLWEEWTPAATAVLPAPAPATQAWVVSNNPGGGTIAAGLDVYIKLAYEIAGSEGPQSLPVVFRNTALNDRLAVTFGELPQGGPEGGPHMPRWLAELNLNPDSFVGLALDVYVAAVAHGATAPASNAYRLYAAGLGVGDFVAVSSIPTSNVANVGLGGLILTRLAATQAGWTIPSNWQGESGTRYMILLRRDKNDTLSPVDPDSAIPVVFTQGATQPIVFCPTGGPNDGLDIAAFTVAGDSSVGPFFWIPKQDPQAQVTSVAPPRNGIALQFNDNFLSNDEDVTSQLTAIPVGPVVDVYFCPSLNKMVYTPGNSSEHWFSNSGDPGNIQSPDGILSVAPNDGGLTVCFREMVNGELLSLKENAGYAIAPDDLAPAKWTPIRRWDKHGPVGARAVAVGPDFLLIFTRSGPFRYYQGQLEPVGQEKQATWERVNWEAAKEVWIEIDDNAKVARFGLPLDGASQVNTEMTLDYFKGWGGAMREAFGGGEIVNHQGRRWSENDCPARYGKLVKRTLANPIDNRINDRQMLYGMSEFVDAEIPDVYDDNGAAIDWQYQPAYTVAPDLSILLFAGLKGRAKGSGALSLQAVTEDPSFGLPADSVDLKNGIPTPFAKGVRVTNERMAYLFSNGQVAGSWAELHEVVMYSRPEYPAQRGG